MIDADNIPPLRTCVSNVSKPSAHYITSVELFGPVVGLWRTDHWLVAMGTTVMGARGTRGASLGRGTWIIHALLSETMRHFNTVVIFLSHLCIVVALNNPVGIHDDCFSHFTGFFPPSPFDRDEWSQITKETSQTGSRSLHGELGMMCL